MISLRKPSPETIESFRASQAKLELSYSAVGATATTPPPDYTVDHTRVKLGHGENIFARAKLALQGWDHMRLGWLETLSSQPTIKPGDVVVIRSRSLGVWSLGACRIVYLIDDAGPSIARFGFGYGTLPDHVGTGEERFMVEWDRSDDSVWFDILAFSRPQMFLMRIAYPWMRRVQKRFGREAVVAMMQAVGSG